MKVLVVSPAPTHPTRAGNRSCILSYVELLRRQGHEVEFLYLHLPWAHQDEGVEELRDFWKDRLHIFRESVLDRLVQIVHHRFAFRLLGRYTLDALLPFGFSRAVGKLVSLRNIDAVIVNYWHLSGAFRCLPAGVRKVLYTHDLFRDRIDRTGSSFLSTDGPTEGRALDRADVVLAIQEQEAADFRARTSSRVLTSFSHFPLDSRPFTNRKNLLYLAGPNPNNIQGIREFVGQVLPVILSRDPAIRLLIGGRICSELPDLAGLPGVELQGDVDRMGDFYAQGDLAINPTRTGSGLKIKTFEAMAHGRAMICHPHCLEGIFRPERHPMVSASTPMEYADRICELFADPSRLEALCLSSLEYVRDLDAEVERSFSVALAART
ncbi:MAG: glycosyltransferase family 4 protein [Fibrobacterota bacterium]|nr:glycosyltransferase family 4 protein [Fibrobacterota bacterium]QQS03795.1 MAG: glycosyltransferase family 4 protein [Fibrobacterota bacterium]